MLLVAELIVLLYCPAFIFALPEAITINITEEIEKEEAHDQELEMTHGSDYQPQTNETETSARQDETSSVIPDVRLVIPVDDTSPITWQVVLQNCANKLPGFQLSFNVKLVCLSYLVVPFLLYIDLLLKITLKVTT